MKSKLFEMVQKMPKDGRLHSHADAMVDASCFLKLALGLPAVHVRTETILPAENMKAVLPEFRRLPPSEFTSPSSLTQDYVPGT
ncbi:hypothetical protein ACEPAH_4995 [Sanghuangporus vaninii]